MSKFFSNCSESVSGYDQAAGSDQKALVMWDLCTRRRPVVAILSARLINEFSLRSKDLCGLGFGFSSASRTPAFCLGGDPIDTASQKNPPPLGTVVNWVPSQAKSWSPATPYLVDADVNGGARRVPSIPSLSMSPSWLPAGCQASGHREKTTATLLLYLMVHSFGMSDHVSDVSHQADSNEANLYCRAAG
jgi:hypothetical protein